MRLYSEKPLAGRVLISASTAGDATIENIGEITSPDLEGVAITHLTGNLRGREINFTVSAARLFETKIANQVEGLTVTFNTAEASVHIGQGAFSFTGTVDGTATYSPGGSQVASGHFLFEYRSGFTGKIDQLSITASEKVVVDNGIIDLNTGDLSGNVHLNFPGALRGTLTPQVNVKNGNFVLDGDVTFLFDPVREKTVHLHLDKSRIDLTLATDIDASVGDSLGLTVKAGETSLHMARGE